MKKILIASAIGLTILSATQSQAQSWKDVLKGAVKSTTSTSTTTTTSGSGVSLNSLSSTDIVAALRQALEIGAQNAGSRLNTLNGFFG